MSSKNSRKKDLRKFRKLRRKTDEIMNGDVLKACAKAMAKFNKIRIKQ